ncbi:aminotransferase class I/II-fold pyridoxal phosphate-dependent enzyme [Micromonospora sp. CA-248089]|uniref:aminotransferase class I/II-fold pyridoxal phosphate-dependent enzyme n=1 Tax=Micromonospora sp. CA-248089 TaxID=3239960 RepID=UPI003D8EC7FF
MTSPVATGPSSGLIDLTGSFRLWPAPELNVWRGAMARAVRDVDPTLRPQLGGDPFLREQLAAELSVDMDQVAITSGVRAAAPILCRWSRRVVLERPTFLGVQRMLEMNNIPVTTTPWARFRDFTPDRHITFWVTGPCRNPDGDTPDERLLDTLNSFRSAGAQVVCNTSYRWFAPPQPMPEGFVTVGSLHKLAGPGSGLGWVVGHTAHAEETLRHLSIIAPPLHWQRAWGYFLKVGGLGLLTRRLRDIASLRTLIGDALGLPEGPRHGPNMLLPVRMREEQAVATLARRGVRVSPGSAFAASRDSIRISLGSLERSRAEFVTEALACVVDLK